MLDAAERPLLEVRDLAIRFDGGAGRITDAVTGVSFAIKRGETLGIVGESGSGKSVSALAVMRLLPAETARVGGQVLFEGRDLLELSERAMEDIRGNRIAMIFQEPMTALNPAYTIGDQIGETLRRHRRLGQKSARQEAVRLLERVRIPSAARRVDDYPHRLSGGMRQRAMIAMAIACQPAVLIADEPTTALDVTIQAQVLDLLRELGRELGTAIILITHDLGVVAEMCDRVGVMYAGEIVEMARVDSLFESPEHPYTLGLLGSIPRLAGRRERLAAISGAVPVVTSTLAGCRFAPRCPFSEEACRRTTPTLDAIRARHHSRCRRAPLGGLPA